VLSTLRVGYSGIRYCCEARWAVESGSAFGKSKRLSRESLIASHDSLTISPLCKESRQPITGRLHLDAIGFIRLEDQE
jgi:hypothetical protein